MRCPRPTLRTLLVACILGTGACSDRESPTTPLASPETGASITDGTGVDGRDGFFFLPPIAESEPEEADENDPDFLPYLTIEICVWDAETCSGPITEITSDMRPNQGGIRLEEEEAPGHFLAVWRVPDLTSSTPATYRVRVLSSGIELGHADVVVLPDASDLTGYDRSEFVPVVARANLPIRFRVEQARIGGDPTAPVGTQVADAPFVPDPEDYSPDHPTLPGMPISFNTVVLAFEPATTVAEANEILDEFDAQPVGAIASPSPEVPGILFLRLPTADHPALIEVLDQLDGNPAVAVVVPDILLSPTILTPGGGAAPNWMWTQSPADGNWGFERSRVPQMWNLNPGLRKAEGAVFEGAVVGVVDVGFADPGEHEDLAYEENLSVGTRANHGTHVAGTIGATYGNDLGVDGLNPFARLVVQSPDWTDCAGLATEDCRTSWGAEMLQGYGTVVRERQDIRVVNMSLGYNWLRAGIDADTDEDAQKIADDQGVLLAFGQAILESQGFDLPVLVVSAGNDRGRDARYNSPMTNAGIVQGEANIIVVEATTIFGNRAGFSNIGGDVSAPGDQILSTVLPGGPSGDYDLFDGTSMASPHVAGLISYLYTLDDNLPGPTRTSNAVGDLIVANAVDDVGNNGVARIDAFASALDIDRIRGNDRILRMLIDIDDGTVDGNARTVIGEQTGLLLEDADGDGGPGDGTIDMADFRRWRDWLLDTDDSYYEDLNLSSVHPKRDGNGDGLPGTDFEALYSRGDFNGDGVIALTGSRPVPGALGGQNVTDLEVLQSRFSDPDYSASELDDLVFSADFRVDAEACFAVMPVGGSVRTTLTGSGSDEGSSSSFGWFQSRTHDAADPFEFFTGRVGRSPQASRVAIRTEVVDASGTVVAEEAGELFARPGSDRYWTPECGPVGPADGADLAVTQLVEPTGPFKVGEVIEYGADVENLGPDDVPGATFTWVAFGDVALDAVFGDCSEIVNPPVGSVAAECPVGPLSSGSTTDIPIFRIIPQSTNPVTVRASVSPPEGVTDPNLDNNIQERTPTVEPLVLDVFPSLIGDTPDPVQEGEVVRYRVYAQSTSTGDDLPRVLLDLRVDGEADLVSMPTGAGVTCEDRSLFSALAVDVRCEIAPLQAGIASPPLDLEVRALSGPSLEAQAEMIHIASISTDPDLSNNTQSETTTVSPPPSGATAYVAVQGDDQVQAVNVATNAVVATIPTGLAPWGMAPRPGTDELWVTNRNGETITRISTTSNTVIGTIPTQQLLRDDLFDVAFSPDGGTAYVTVNEPVSNAARVVLVNAATGSQISDIRLAQDFPREIRMLPDGSKAYVTTGAGVTVLDLTTNTVAASIALTGGTIGLDVAPDGSAVYVTQRDGTSGLLREIDTTTDVVVGSGIPVGIEPNGVAVSPNGTEAYVANGRALVYIVDLVAETASTIFTGSGTGPQSVDVTSDGALLFVTDRDGGQVLEIDLATQAITPTAVGSFPAEVVIRN